MGSANVATINDSVDGDFWSATAEIANQYDNPMMGKPDWCDEDKYTPGADLEGEGEDIYWPNPGGTAWDIEEMASATITHVEEDLDTLPCTEMYDSGALRHISSHKADFTSYTTLSPPLYINATNKNKFPAIGTGTLIVKVPANGGESDLVLHNALYAPSVCYTLVSLGTLDKVEGYTFRIGGSHLQIFSLRGEPIGEVPCNSRHLYRVEHLLKSAYTAKDMSAMELHCRLGHISIAAARKLVNSGAIRRINLNPDASEVDADCEACIIARATRLPMRKPRISTPAQNFGDEVHTDVWGPLKAPTKGGCHYFIMFTDDATHFMLVYLMNKKSEALKAYKFFEVWAITQQHSTRIKVLHSDRGGEYLSKEFDKHLAAAGTARRLTMHNTPQLNGIAKRLNRMLLERIRALGHVSGLPQKLWGEALRHATWLKNQTATRTLDGKTPFEALYRTPPDLSEVRRWGCKVWVHDDTGSKLDVHAHEARWLGFDVDSRSHRVYWPKTDLVTAEWNVYFGTSAQLKGEEIWVPIMDSEPTAAPNTPTTSNPPSPSIPSPDPSPSAPKRVQEPDNPPVQPRQSTCIHKPLRIIHDLQSGVGITNPHTEALKASEGDPEKSGGVWAMEDNAPMLLEDFDGMESVFTAEMADAEALEPRTLKEAKRRPDWPQWEKAIKEELATLKAAGTWRLEDTPPRANIIGSKWVLKVKKDAAGNIACYKARLVAQGFSQIGGVDYDNTYVPVAKLVSTRAVIAMANRLRMEMHQIDIKGAYLNGELNDNEVLYMQHPPRYKAPDTGTRVLRLVKTLYGLKQSGHRWYQKLSSVFLSLGFKQCAVDQAVYFCVVVHKGELTVIVVHVDDCTIVATTICLIEELKARLRKHFEVTDLGELHWMLGIEVKHDRSGRVVHLSQRAYIDTILRRYHLSDLKPLSTPMDHQVRLTSDQAPASPGEYGMMCDVPYREAVGALNWAALATRPDIAFAVATVAHFAANPGPTHWEAVKWIFRYLSGTCNLWLTYGETNAPLEG